MKKLPPTRSEASELRRRARRGSTLVLCYHGVSESWSDQFAVTPTTLEAHLRFLKRRGYRAVTFREALAETHEDRVVAITFDDAYRSIFTCAFPILASYEMPATAFVPTAFPGSDRLLQWPGIDQWVGTPHEHELTPFDWQEAAQLADAGWEIGSHTMNHPHLTSLSDLELEREMTQSRLECERWLGQSCTSIAYPYGDWDERVVAAAQRAGYKFAASTLFEQWGNVRRLNWPRVPIVNGDDEWVLRKKISPFLLSMRSTRAWPRLVGTWRRLRYRN